MKCHLMNTKTTSSREIIDFSMPFESIKSDFVNKGININSLGFYDDRAFIEVERKYPDYLNNYARFVQTQKYSKSYYSRAEKEIPLIVKQLHDELVEDGRLGACIDISLALSKILENEGFWNYIVKGALTLTFKPNSKILDKHFWPIDNTGAQAGHVWVSAPPFDIIDITIKQQGYREGEHEFLPEYVIEKEIRECNVEVSDIVSSNSIPFIYKTYHNINNYEPYKKAKKVMQVFKPNLIKLSDVELKYIPVAFSAPDGQLKDMKNLCLRGKYPNSIYQDLIAPLLKDFRLN